MNTKIAKFEIISKNEYIKNSDINTYSNIQIPQRATSGSAGYDFFSPIEFTLLPNCEIKIYTGIRVMIQNGWFLQILPRSSLGFKYRATLNNTVGIIDSDYYYANNEGHIIIKMTNMSNNTLHIDVGDAFCQGIFIQYGLTIDDNCTNIRTGGIGSTNIKK